MRSTDFKAKVKALLRRHARLKCQVGKLVAAQSHLQFQQKLLSALCESFTVYQASQAVNVLSDDALVSCIGRYNDLVQQEADLLQGLTPESPSPPPVGSLSGVVTIAPRHDPLAYFKRHIEMPPLPNAATITTAQLARSLCSTVLESSVHLNLLQTGVPAAGEESLRRLQQLWDRHIHSVVSVLLIGRMEVMEQLNLYDMVQMAPVPGAEAKRALKVAGLPGALGLDDRQLREIAAGADIFMNLFAKVMKEQQELQAELSAGEYSSGLETRSSQAGALYQHSSPGRKGLEDQERATARLQSLMRKDYALRAAATGWFFGCLSWEQLTKAAIICWPYAIRPTEVVEHIARYARERQLC